MRHLYLKVLLGSTLVAHAVSPLAVEAAGFTATKDTDRTLVDTGDATGTATATRDPGLVPGDTGGAGDTWSPVDDGPLTRIPDLEVKLFGGEFEQWADAWNDAAPIPLEFRWRAFDERIEYAMWQVRTGDAVLAQGYAGAAPATDSHRYFTIDFRDIAGITTTRPLYYRVNLLTYGKDTPDTAGSDPGIVAGRAERRIGNVGSVAGVHDSVGVLTRIEPLGVQAAPVFVTLTEPGPGTRFSDIGLYPELARQMDIVLELETLTFRNGDDAEEPYLFVAAVFADGTTVIPVIDTTQQSAGFPTSTVRVVTQGPTHGNVPGGDQDQSVAIPAGTGRFATTIRPVGVGSGVVPPDVGEDTLRRLRENTLVGILAIGFEEDALPSTGTINASRDLLIQRLQERFTEKVRSLTVAVDTQGVQVPDVEAEFEQLIDKLQKELKKEITAFAKAEGVEELVTLLSIPGFHVFTTLGAANRDDYIGHGNERFSYQELLDAGPAGIEFSMTLDQNCACVNEDKSETTFYEIDGRVRMLLPQ